MLRLIVSRGFAAAIAAAQGVAPHFEDEVMVTRMRYTKASGLSKESYDAQAVTRMSRTTRQYV